MNSARVSLPDDCSARRLRPFALSLIAGLWTVIGAATPRDGARNEFGMMRLVTPDQFIPLTNPAYLPAGEAKLSNGARVLGVVISDDTRCFPLRQMWYHHVVNDTLGGKAVAVTYCVMADTAVTFLRDTTEEELCAGALFGGVLALQRKNSTELWPQIAAVPIPDCPTSRTLRLGPPPVLTTFGRWKAKYPQTRVLAPVAEFDHFYEAFDRRAPGYRANPLMNETVVRRDTRLPPGTEVFGLGTASDSIAWPLTAIRKARRVTAQVGNQTVEVTWDSELDTPRLTTPFEGFSMCAFWYAWASFYPATRLEGMSEKGETK